MIHGIIFYLLFIEKKEQFLDFVDKHSFKLLVDIT
jgi:hypothetical protein